MLEIVQLPVLKDNYSYLLRDQTTNLVAVVDPSEPQPIIKALEARKWRLSYILNTHHHFDHTGGNLPLKGKYASQIIGPRSDEGRIPGIDETLGDGEVFRLGESDLQALHVPGHTTGHTALFSAKDKALFCGDTLFTLGCGFLFEGTPEQMWKSLVRLRNLPGDTRVFCGHEYTLENAEFARHFEPENEPLKKYVERAAAQVRAGEPTVPSMLRDEVLCNPFFHADDPAIRRSLGMESGEAYLVFGKIRTLKNQFDDAKKP